MAENSIVQLRAALRNARRATVARAAALADALGVNPPKNLLVRRVLNEHRERLVVRDVTAGGCTYHSPPARVETPSVVDARGRAGAMVGTREGTAATTGAKPRPHQHRHDHYAPPSLATGADHILRSGESSERVVVSRSAARNKDCSRNSAMSTAEAVTAERAIRSRASPPLTDARNGAAETIAPSTFSSNPPDLGWNREWSRSVDTWCRNASARFRSRVAGEVVGAARRLHWLAGSGRDGGFKDGACDSTCSGSRQSVAACAGTRGKGASAGRWNDRPVPTEKIGAEGWAALAAFGDVADLLEIVGSTAELVISIEVDSTNREPRPTENTAALQVQDGTDAPTPTASQDHTERGLVTEEEAWSPRGDKGLANPIAEPNSAAATLSYTAEGSINEEGRAVALASAAGIVGTKNRKNCNSNPVSDVTGQRQDPRPQGLQQDTARLEPKLRKGFDPAPHRSAPTSRSFAGTSEAAEVVGTKVSHPRSVPRQPKLAAVDEEAHSATESSSEDDQERAEVEDALVGASEAFSRTSESGRESRLDAGTEQGSRLDMEAAPEDGEPDSGGYGGEPKGSATVGNLQREHDEVGSCTVRTGCAHGPLATARIIVGPAEIETALGVPALSAFVLQAARGKHHHLSTPMNRCEDGGVQGIYKNSGNPPSMSDALGCPERARNNIGKNTEVRFTSLVSREETNMMEGVLEIGSATLRARPHSDACPWLSIEGQAGTRIISATEKLGLACAVETLIFPRVRIILRPKPHRTSQPSDKAPTKRLRLKVDLSQASNTKGGIGSRTDDAVARAARAQPSPKPAQEANSAATVATAEVPSRAPTIPAADLLPEVEGEARQEPESPATTAESKIVWTRRYTEAPMQRWVGRLNGRRCLFSCSAAPHTLVSRPSSSGGGRSSRSVERLPGGGGAGGAHGKKNVGVDADYTYAMFTPKHIASSVRDVDHLSSVEPQQHVLIGRAKGVQPPSTWSGRPLCRNCGRRALLQLVVSTDLLAQSPLQSSLCPSQLLLLPPEKIASNLFPHRRDNSIDCGLTTAERYHSGRGCRSFEQAASRGRFANWVCRSGAILCTRCLRTLRSAEVPLERM